MMMKINTLKEVYSLSYFDEVLFSYETLYSGVEMWLLIWHICIWKRGAIFQNSSGRFH